MQTIYIIATIVLLSTWTLFDKLAIDRIHPLYVQIITTLVGVLLIPVWYVFLPKHTSLNISGIGFAVLGGLSAILATATYLLAATKSDISTITGYTSTYPLLTLILATLFLGETFTITRLCGIACIVGGAFLLSR